MQTEMQTESTTTTPRMLTIRQTARTGILPENALRRMVRDGTCPHIKIGAKSLINYDKLIDMLREV